jgi:hypothetical protein
LAICQFCLLVVARLVVSHAAVSAARAAIVVLPDDPKYYSDTPRGIVSDSGGVQQGSRMAVIRSAATQPLKLLAPGLGALIESGKNIANALTSMSVAQSIATDFYTNFATAVTLHDMPNGDGVAREPIAANATVTARVIYYYQCDIPIVRGLICASADTLVSEKWSPFRTIVTTALGSGSSIGQTLSERRFFKFTASATLPNQGAQYEQGGGDE